MEQAQKEAKTAKNKDLRLIFIGSGAILTYSYIGIGKE
jgi:hypothetical protein